VVGDDGVKAAPIPALGNAQAAPEFHVAAAILGFPQLANRAHEPGVRPGGSPNE